MHELDAERRAIGPLAESPASADGGVFEAQHVVDEDRHGRVVRVQSRRCRIKLGCALFFAQVSADRDRHADGRACGRRGSSSWRAPNPVSPCAAGRRQARCRFGAPCRASLPPMTSRRRPVAVKGGNQFAIERHAASLGRAQGRRWRSPQRRRIVSRLAKKSCHSGSTEFGSSCVSGVQLFDVVRRCRHKGMRCVRTRRSRLSWPCYLLCRTSLPCLYEFALA